MTEPTPPSQGTIHFLKGAENSQLPPLFGGHLQMPLPTALTLRNLFTLIDGDERATVPFDQIEEQFQRCVYGALSRAGFEMPPHLDWQKIYSPALHSLAMQVAQGTFMEMNEAEPRQPMASLMLKAEKLGLQLNLKLHTPSPVILAPATDIQAIIPDSPSPTKS